MLFRQLTKDDMVKIVDLEIDKLRKRLAEKGMSLSLDKASLDFLISKGWDEKYGARPLKRAIERELEDSLAEEILKGSIVEEAGVILVTLDEGGKRLHFSQKKSSGRDPAKTAQK